MHAGNALRIELYKIEVMEMNMKRYSGILTAIVFLFSAVAVFGSGNGPGVSADEAQNKLKEGNALFVNDTPSKAVIDQKRRLEVAKGQKPYVTILGCSDSRESLEHIFSAGLGELFVIRVAGNVSDTDELGSMEYGVDHLGTPLLLVLGHTDCGAVTAVATKAQVHGHIPALVDNIIPAVDAARKKLGANASKDELVLESITGNIYQSMADILSKSPIIAKRVKEGKVKVIGALYHLDKGTIDWLGEHPEQDALTAQALASNSGHGGKESAEHAEQPLVTKALIACSMILAISGLFFVFFISERRLFRGLKFKARLILSFLSVIISLVVSLVYSFDLYKAGSGSTWIAIAIPFCLTVAISIMMTMSHIKAFRIFFEESMRKAAEE